VCRFPPFDSFAFRSRLSRLSRPCLSPHDTRATNSHVELKRTDGSVTILRLVWRMLPRNGGRALLLVCSNCNTPCRHVYGWEWASSSDGQTELSGSVGGVVLVPGSAILPKAAICVRAQCFARGETCHARSCGFHTSSLTLTKRLKADAYVDRPAALRGAYGAFQITFFSLFNMTTEAAP
jgi:hypothetical protein